MSAAVLIPWRGGCPHRTLALKHIIRHYTATLPGTPVELGVAAATAPWCKAMAIADALRRTTADLLVIADADVCTEELAPAIAAVGAGAAWAIPHKGVHRLTEAATGRYVAGAVLQGLALAEPAYRGVEGGGIVVLTRETYEACPLDARFEGWGSEDESWGFALRTLFGAPWRSNGALVHLWHPPQPRATRARGSDDSWELRKRYARAQGNAAAMAALIEEGRDVTRQAHQPVVHDQPPRAV